MHMSKHVNVISHSILPKMHLKKQHAMWPDILLLVVWQDWGVLFVLLLYVTDYFNQNIAFLMSRMLFKSTIRFNSNVVVFVNVRMIWVTSKTKQQWRMVHLNKPENRKGALVCVLQSSPPSCGPPQQMVPVYLLLFQTARTKQGGVPFSTINTVIERFLNMLTMTNSCLNLFCSLSAL